MIVAMNGRLVVDDDLSKHLHPNDGVDKKQHDNEEGYVRQCLEGLDKSPK